ncbi:hypothetical protein SAMN03159423_4896 [Bradyrhizobium sp. NFR13]|uniref:hypothetical protein n=1 Tax=Bradyrhizobium sp. NFR13 TaxID=1566285 RepID=UPI0008EEBAC9|nr:hypothetical protein [Bradyrhizobium sp. NFR13]SFM00984.1 hypothetical protein SAMN03159423_4896 [Bradyrhizobium sp. NFR13]
MTRLFSACALLCAFFTMPAEAKQLRRSACTETGTVMAPSCMGQSANFLAGVRSIRVIMKREMRRKEITQKANRHGQKSTVSDPKEISSFGIPSPDIDYRIARPARYIAGRLICAINVGAALAERGIKGTGSALARSYDRWGVRVAQPVPGAVAVTDRRGGGHVAIVSRVEGSRVFVWNPSTRGRGWREVEYTNRHARYRVAGVP